VKSTAELVRTTPPRYKTTLIVFVLFIFTFSINLSLLLSDIRTENFNNYQKILARNMHFFTSIELSITYKRK